MTWITPFDAGTSANTTFASLTITPSPTEKVKSSPFTAPATKPSVTAEDGTAPDTRGIGGCQLVEPYLLHYRGRQDRFLPR